MWRFFPWTRRLPKVKSGHSEEIAAGKAPRNAASTAREGRAGQGREVEFGEWEDDLSKDAVDGDAKDGRRGNGSRHARAEGLCFQSRDGLHQIIEGSDAALVAAPSLDLCTWTHTNKNGCRNQHQRKKAVKECRTVGTCACMASSLGQRSSHAEVDLMFVAVVGTVGTIVDRMP